MINRRSLLKASLLLSTPPITPLFSLKAASAANIVIVGAGWGGLSAAKTLRNLNPKLNITIIDKKDNFVSCPISNWVIGQIKEMKDITFSYKKFIGNNRINFLNDNVNHIDLERKKITLNDKTVFYDKLILSPGVQFKKKTIDGLSNYDNKDSVFISWEAGYETSVFSNRIKELKNKENIIISIPLSPYRCPPGPYERASLLAAYIKKKKFKSKVLVLDANQSIISKGKLFSKAWQDLYPDIIEYKPDHNVIAISVKEKKVFTDFDEFDYDIANIIPEQTAPKLLFQSSLILKNKKWASVNPYDFSSKKVNDVYVIGDATDRASVGSVPKSGYIAYSMGKVCGYAVHNALLDKEPPSPSMINTCYSLVSQNEGISVSAVYKHDKNKNKIVTVKDASGVSPERSETIAYNAFDWARAIWNDMLT